MTVIEQELIEALRRELRANKERLNWLASYDTPNSHRLREEITCQLAAITERLTQPPATRVEPSALQSPT